MGCAVGWGRLLVGEVHQIGCHQCCCLCAQSAFAKRDWLETVVLCPLHFFNREVAFGSYHDHNIFAWPYGLPKRELELEGGDLVVAMADEPLHFAA